MLTKAIFYSLVLFLFVLVVCSWMGFCLPSCFNIWSYCILIVLNFRSSVTLLIYEFDISNKVKTNLAGTLFRFFTLLLPKLILQLKLLIILVIFLLWLKLQDVCFKCLCEKLKYCIVKRKNICCYVYLKKESDCTAAYTGTHCGKHPDRKSSFFHCWGLAEKLITGIIIILRQISNTTHHTNISLIQNISWGLVILYPLQSFR